MFLKKLWVLVISSLFTPFVIHGAELQSRDQSAAKAKRLARYAELEWETGSELLDTQVMKSVLDESMTSDRCDNIKLLIKQWEKTPGVDAYDFETEDEARRACLLLLRNVIVLGTSKADKVMLARAITQKCKMKVFSKDALSIINSYDLKMIFDHANNLQKKCAIVVDNIDFLFSHDAKDAEQHRHDANILGALCSLLDKYDTKPILFIGTARSVSKAPPQIRSRFEGDSLIETSAFARKIQRKQAANQWKIPIVASLATLAMFCLGYRYCCKQSPAAIITH